MLSGLLLTAVLFWLVRQAELASFRTRLESDVSQRTDTIINKIDDSVLVATALHNYFAASQQVTREEFSSFSRPFLQERGEIKALSWDPRIPHAQRGHFEEQGCNGLDEEFFIYERDSKGDRLPAGNRNFYYPVCYIEPMGENRKAIGFDVGSDPVRLAALERARDTGKPTATERIMLVQEGKSTSSVLVFNPLFAKGIPAATVAERRMALQGFTVVVFNMEKLLFATLGKTRPIGLSFDLLDLSAPSGPATPPSLDTPAYRERLMAGLSASRSSRHHEEILLLRAQLGGEPHPQPGVHGTELSACLLACAPGGRVVEHAAGALFPCPVCTAAGAGRTGP